MAYLPFDQNIEDPIAGVRCAGKDLCKQEVDDVGTVGHIETVRDVGVAGWIPMLALKQVLSERVAATERAGRIDWTSTGKIAGERILW